MELNIHLAKKIKDLRKSKKMKQAEMAEAIGISHRYLQTIEAGQVDLKLSFVQKISQTLSVSPCYLLQNNDQALNQVGIHCIYELLNYLPIAIHITMPDGKIVFSNSKLQKIIPSSVNSSYFQEIFNDLSVSHRISQVFKTTSENLNGIIFEQIKNEDKMIPLRIEWHFLNENQKTQSPLFLFATSFHLSW
jgi:transcriptional regulator with XRE-family HTH domain